MKIVNPTPISPDELNSFLDPESLWYAEEKVDGNRVVIESVAGERVAQLTAKNKKGQTEVRGKPIKIPWCVMPLAELNLTFTLDGEGVGGRNNWHTYVCFGFLKKPIGNGSAEKVMNQFSLEMKVDYTNDRPLKWLTPATGQFKRWLYSLLKNAKPKREGLVFKKNGTMRKFVFLGRVDAFLIKWHENPEKKYGGAVEVGVYNKEGDVVSIAKVRPGLSHARIDEIRKAVAEDRPIVMEINYLSARTIGTVLNQPRCVRFRDDKSPNECTLDQLERELGKRW